MLNEEVKEHKEDACWNCRLYDECERKWYVTGVCEKYVSVHYNKK